MPIQKKATKRFLLAAFSVLAFLSLFSVVVTAYASSEKEAVRMEVLDDCNPATFNAALFPGACNVAFRGETTFREFINQLRKDKVADEWVFDPDEVDLNTGDTLVIVSRGGEFHTFTEVAAFGGGVVPLLNELSGNPVPRPECFRIPSDSNIGVPSFLSGAPFPTNSLTAGGSVLTPGTHHFQCCIHPWMRATVTVGK